MRLRLPCTVFNGRSKIWRDRRDSLYRRDSRSCGRRDRL